MSDELAEFDVERWECVPGGEGAALLRLTGEWRSGRRPSPAASSLLVETRYGVGRHSPLPDPAAERPEGGWRVAFAIDAGVLQAPAGYRLIVPDQPAHELGPPTGSGVAGPGAEDGGAAAEEGSSGPRGALATLLGRRTRRWPERTSPQPEGAPADPRDDAPDDERAGAELLAERDRRIGLETAVLMWRDLERKERTARETAEVKLAELAASAERPRAEAQAALQRVRDLEARVAELTQTLDSERGERQALGESGRRLQAELAQREKELQKALAKAERRSVKIAALNQDLSQAKEKQPLRIRRRIEALTQELTQTKAALAATRAQLAEGEYGRARLQQELARQEQRLEAAATAASRGQETFQAVQTRLEAELASAAGERAELVASIEQLRAEHAATLDALARSGREAEQLEADLRRKDAELEQAAATGATVAEARDHALSRAATLEEALLEADGRAVALREGREEMAASVEELRLEHVAAADALARSKRDVEELAQALETEQSGSQALADQVQDLEADLRRKDAELEQAAATGAAVAEARDYALSRVAALEQALLEADGRAVALRETRDELAASVGELRLEHVAAPDALARSKRDVEDLDDQRSALEAEPAEPVSTGRLRRARANVRPRGPGVMAQGDVEGLSAHALEELRSEALHGQELAAEIEERAVWLLDAVAAEA